ncbi:hypothetical protein, variant [Aphanomyces astaci]|uniref:Rad51-like C-terminal domain-containing protein n=1 Tax=Aphanomyces astaci TaxID=112090 RepID=W4FXX1_APHAT|nr:hypothetical protein, variant [Aphanomyces astaci]ETV71619.1 hypothetical protein, variant [Aphanomyces astaci]|eukprot:XP_009838807.1 hypothetical protein, variant [Aphanomyces astaci]
MISRDCCFALPQKTVQNLRRSWTCLSRASVSHRPFGRPCPSSTMLSVVASPPRQSQRLLGPLGLARVSCVCSWPCCAPWNTTMGQCCTLTAAATSVPRGTHLHPSMMPSLLRFMQLATERISPQQYSTDVLRKSKVEAIARQVQVVAVENLDRLETKVRELTESMPLIKMIIIDSLATLAKHSSTDMSVATRQMLLMRVASVLKLLASTYDAYVITTNHTTTRKDQMGLYSQPALGLAWSHCITNRVVLEKTSPSTKAMTVHKAAVAGPACIPYILTKAGVLPPEGAVGVPCVDDDEFPWDAAMMLGDFDDAQDDGFRLHPVQHASQRDSQSGGIPPDDIASQEEMVAATPSDDEQVDTKVEHLATELGQLEDSRQAARDMALSIVDDIVPASDDEEEE